MPMKLRNKKKAFAAMALVALATPQATAIADSSLFGRWWSSCFQANNSNFCRSRARASLRDQPLALPAWDQQEETEQSDSRTDRGRAIDTRVQSELVCPFRLRHLSATARFLAFEGRKRWLARQARSQAKQSS